MKTALVIGATGVSGRALLKELEAAGDWKIYAAARRSPQFKTTAIFVPVDLMDGASCREAFTPLKDVTHVFWTSYTDRPTFAETREPNARMFTNAIPAIEANAALEHICICQGTKYYGQHLGRFKTPAREADSRIDEPHYYYDWQDFTVELQRDKSWSWSAARPHVICGFALGNPLNIISIIGTFGTICRELGRPLTFPGKPGAFTSLYQATDASLLGRAMIWMATTEKCRNQAFNVTNGDYFRYENLWPTLATFFGVEAGGVEHVSLEQTMVGKEDLWGSIVTKYGLTPTRYAEVADWHFADYAFSNEWDVMSSTTKCRQYGFMEFVDSEAMYVSKLEEFVSKGIFPDFSRQPVRLAS